MSYAQVNAINLHYTMQGQGQPLLLIMGLGGPAAAWDREFVARMADDYQVITYDNRGTGQSDKPDEPYSIALFASDAVGLLGALDIPRAHIFGISMGGMIAQEIGIHHQQHLASLTLGCTTPGGKHSVPAPPESMQALKGRPGQTPEEAVREGWKLSYSQDYIAAHQDELEATMRRVLEHATPFFAYKRHLDATMTLRVYRQLKEITAPTLVTTGRGDVLIPAANSEILAREIPNAQLAIFDNAGHGFVSSAREPFLTVFKEFLSQHPL
jgi:pimeloyl-ACP methyl ester carboxylesterase